MRRLVICCDGTWNTPDQPYPTNVWKFARAVRTVDDMGTAQIIFYDEGVGTGNFLDRLTGGAFGDGLSRNVRDGYRFIVNNFENGDEIYLIGFSRGAFTARSIAGLIRKCGILQKTHADKISQAYDLYRKRDESADSVEARRFRAAYAQCLNQIAGDECAVKIRCIAVWDTVGALGVPEGLFRSVMKYRYQFHDVQLSSRVENAFHALAIDEKRRFFEPTLWTTRPEALQRVEQVWFPGVHSNVGGGYPDSGASDWALRWMIERVSSCGLAFSPEALTALRPNALAPLNESRRGWYLLFPPYRRTIGTSADEAVHASARERYERMDAYRPGNLVDYFTKRPEAIAAPGTPRLVVSGVEAPSPVLPAATPPGPPVSPRPPAP